VVFPKLIKALTRDTGSYFVNHADAELCSECVTEWSVIYFVSVAVAVDSSHMTASSSTSWSRFSPPLNFVDGHVLTVLFMVCRWPQSQEGDWARPLLCKLA